MVNLRVMVIVVGSALALASPLHAQQPIDPVDFKPFVDGRNWIVRQPLTYTIGISKDSVTVPPGFVTDFASIPQVLQSIIRQNGLYLLPAVVHDYLYWKQTCTREESDRILLLAMIENKVGDFHRIAIYEAGLGQGSLLRNGDPVVVGWGSGLPHRQRLVTPRLQSQSGETQGRRTSGCSRPWLASLAASADRRVSAAHGP